MSTSNGIESKLRSIIKKLSAAGGDVSRSDEIDGKVIIYIVFKRCDRPKKACDCKHCKIWKELFTFVLEHHVKVVTTKEKAVILMVEWKKENFFIPQAKREDVERYILAILENESEEPQKVDLTTTVEVANSHGLFDSLNIFKRPSKPK